MLRRMHCRQLPVVLLLSMTLVLAAGCSGSQEGVNPRGPSSESGAALQTAKIFLTASNSVYVLNARGAVTATITQGLNAPEGLAVDTLGDLFVANTGADNILMFSPPYTSQPLTIADKPGTDPLDVAVDGQGNFAVTNIETKNGNGDVVLYTAGATVPTSVVSSKHFQEPRYCAFDKSGNLFIDNITSSPPGFYNESHTITIGEIPGGVGGRSLIRLTTANENDGIGAGGIQITNDGKIVLIHYELPGSEGGETLTYGAPQGRNLGTPQINVLSGSVQPLTFAFLGGDSKLITADFSLSKAVTYRYPAGSEEKSFSLPSGQSPLGVAVYPPQ